MLKIYVSFVNCQNYLEFLNMGVALKTENTETICRCC